MSKSVFFDCFPTTACYGVSRMVAGFGGTRAIQSPQVARGTPCLGSEVGKQSKKTLLDIFGRYIEGYMTLFDTI